VCQGWQSTQRKRQRRAERPRGRTGDQGNRRSSAALATAGVYAVLACWLPPASRTVAGERRVLAGAPVGPPVPQAEDGQRQPVATEDGRYFGLVSSARRTGQGPGSAAGPASVPPGVARIVGGAHIQ